MSTWDDLAASHDTTAIAHQLIEECTQLDIAALRDDPIGTIDRYPSIKLVYAPHVDVGCGSGYYRPDPPTVYLHSSSYRRNAFTVLHELAHHLQRHHIEWGFHLMDIRDTNHRLRIEEMVCDSLPKCSSQQSAFQTMLCVTPQTPWPACMLAPTCHTLPPYKALRLVCRHMLAGFCVLLTPAVLSQHRKPLTASIHRLKTYATLT